MTNKEFYSTRNKLVQELMNDFSKSGFQSFDKWLESERFWPTNDVTFITKGGMKISPETAYMGKHELEFVCIENDLLKRNNACFKVRLDDLDAETGDFTECQWSKSEEMVDCIPCTEDGVISGKAITDNFNNNLNIMDFPAFHACWKDGGFLPTIFQFKHLWKHKDEISSVMMANGWKKPFEKVCDYWSSTQDSSTHAWYWGSGGYWSDYGKVGSFCVLRFFAI